MLKPVWRTTNHSVRTRINISGSSVLSVLLYGTECCKTTVAIQRKLEVFQSKCFRHIHSVRGAPWSAANRLHGQRTGAFSLRRVLGLSRKTDQFRLDPTQNCAPGWWCDRESSVYHLALEMYSGIYRHATNPLALSCMPTKHQLHPCPHPTQHSHDYHTHTPTVTNPTAFHAQL